MERNEAFRFETLDLLRGIAALAVVTLHYSSMTGAAPLLPHAYLAVDLFFALSGFVIAQAYAARLQEGLGVSEFMIRRLIRLYPLYLLATVIGWIILAGSHHVDGSATRTGLQWALGFGSNLLFLPAAPADMDMQSNLFPAVFPAWSLQWELIANLVYALVVRKLNWPFLTLILIAGLGLIVVTGIQFDALDGGARWSNALGGPCRILWSYFAGVAAHRLFCEHRALPRTPPALLSVLLLVTFAIPRMGWATDVCIAIALPVAVLAGAQAPQKSKVGHFLGYVSYAVYVMHVWIIDLANGFITRWLGHPPAPAAELLLMPFIVAGVLLLSFILSRTYDAPFRGSLTDTLDCLRRTAAAPQASA